MFLSLKTYISPGIKEGAIEEKTVTGIRENERFILLRENYDGVEVYPDFERFFPSITDRDSLSLSSRPPDFPINESMETKIKAVYPEIEYSVRVQLCMENEIEVYRLNREDFNRMRVGAVAKFELDRTERDLIKKVLEI
ncbi:MAG: hypothetical protein PHV51_08085 [Methanosarcinaceae archaeon]|nr:hypothetical protein [Methanosarcinaceae archaeon]MDD4498089.1 hypothetical protein [Methanosarcinaceae archaeon]